MWSVRTNHKIYVQSVSKLLFSVALVSKLQGDWENQCQFDPPSYFLNILVYRKTATGVPYECMIWSKHTLFKQKENQTLYIILQTWNKQKVTFL